MSYTVKQLREWLNKEEAKFDKDDGCGNLLGKFEDQPILVCHYSRDESSVTLFDYIFKGYGPMKIVADFTLGILFEQEET